MSQPQTLFSPLTPLSEAEWIAVIDGLYRTQQASCWALGDAWIYGDHRYGERAAIARAHRWPLKTLMNHGSVSRAFPISRRRDVLPWSHHAAVAGLPAQQAEEFLDWAAEPLERGRPVRSLRDLQAAVHRSRVCLGEPVSDATCNISDLESLIRTGYRAGTIYADPPWRYPNTGSFGSSHNYFVTMSVDEIAGLPIRDLVADDAHLHLWIVTSVWWDVREIVESWGFRSMPPHDLVWHKLGNIGMGALWRRQHETLLSFSRGKAKFANVKRFRSVVTSPRLEPCEKPNEIRSIIEQVSPQPRLELFGRKPVADWKVWGNQVLRRDFAA